MGKKADLTSIPTLVESPFIIVDIGGYTFGSYAAKGSLSTFTIQYPNYVKNLRITKINGSVNIYSFNLDYQVAYGQDPNLIDKILGTVASTRRITFHYGDWNAPGYIYKDEQAIITKVTSNLDMQNSIIHYTLECTGDAYTLYSTSYNFPSRFAKPSDVLRQLLASSRYGLKNVFKGMQNQVQVIDKGWIASNDKPVNLEAKRGISIFQYIIYLVESMTTSVTNRVSTYMLSIHDDYDNEYGGTYFRVTEVSDYSPNFISTDTYEVDINYPDNNLVTQFTVNNDQSWAILYDYSDDISQEEYVYRITDEGVMTTERSPSMVRSKVRDSTSPMRQAWWNKMTQFPITAELTIKGLTRPTLLMTYVKVNVWFHGGNKHISSGLYIITKQVDTVDESGYKTVLSLLRVGGDPQLTASGGGGKMTLQTR